MNVMGSPHAGHDNATVDLLEWNLDEHRDHPYLITSNNTFSYGDVVERARTFGAGLLVLKQALIRHQDCIYKAAGPRTHEWPLRVRPDSSPRGVLT